MSELIDREALKDAVKRYAGEPIKEKDRKCQAICLDILGTIDAQPTASLWHGVEGELPTIEAVPIKFIDEVIEYLTKCRDYAIHEETKTTWDEQRQTLIMLLHEWAAWNECGRTGKYGERREE